MSIGALKIRRGSYDDLPPLMNGELAYAVDINALFVGSPEGNRRLGDSDGVGDMEALDTVDKSTLVNAINEVLSEIHDHIEDKEKHPTIHVMEEEPTSNDGEDGDIFLVIDDGGSGGGSG